MGGDVEWAGGVTRDKNLPPEDGSNNMDQKLNQGGVTTQKGVMTSFPIVSMTPLRFSGFKGANTRQGTALKKGF